MSILITGNMGYVGPAVVRQLRLSRPNELLIGYDTGYFASALTTTSVLPETQLNAQLFGDVRSIPENLFDGIDAVVHLAAISNDPMGKAFESVTRVINHDAGIDLAVKARQSGVKSFVFASSCSVYGFAEDGARTESSPVNPLTAYARSKVDLETDLGALANRDFKVTCLRFATACGWSPRLRLDLVLNDFVASAVAVKKIDILSDGTPWRPLINVKDMARAIDWALGRSAASGGDYLIVNAGSDEWNYQVKDLAAAVQRFMPIQISINPNAPPDKRSYRVDFSLFRQLAPRHQPVHNLDATIRELRGGLESIGFSDPNFRESRLIRLKMLNSLKNTAALSDDLYWKRIPA